MVIAAHIHSPGLQASQLLQSLRFLAAQHTDTDFIIFTNDTGFPEALPSNIKFMPVQPALKSNLRLHYWYHYRLPSLLKKLQAGIFISDTGITNTRIKVPAWLWIGHTGFLQKKTTVPSQADRYLRKYFPQFLQAATGILLKEDFMKEQLLQTYPAAAGKCFVAGQYLDEIFHPMDEEHKTTLLEKLSDGTEYYYCACTPYTKDNITTVLKAFSLFKKRLKSSLKLVLHLKGVSLEDCVQEFRLYKYRQDVIIADHTTAFSAASLMAASYAVIHLPAELNGLEQTGIAAFASGVPLITIAGAADHLPYKDAALFSKMTDISIADHMMMLYKDEELRKEYISKGLQAESMYTLPAVADRLWQTILPSLPEKAQ
ncbi:MAG: hypothetical protein QM687_16945 [Ferruginibacter sp.]